MPSPDLSFDLLHPQPLIVVISGPSGIGKDAVLKELKKRNTPLHFVITATTRPIRPGEKDGVDYFFLAKEEFERKIAHDDFIEYAWVYEDYKGIPRSQVEEAVKSGKDVVLRLDVQGAATIRKLYPEAVLVFLVPTDTREWYDRLCARKTETPETLKVRVSTAIREIEQIGIFDYIVLNAQDRLNEAVEDIIDILKVEHLKVHHRRMMQE
jgi:guanylate kinase